ncbi:MAG: hypothetical protein CVU55_13780 [Deltaproteobacteria bacterium HGW-Deltaproteobacteria-13]|jgi:uncharacterized protein|nr:MAG: hypothetical protein CVU55_13780 [Deltaproteobacteria bacterium HGW-Deltaproteobacteria-13]
MKTKIYFILLFLFLCSYKAFAQVNNFDVFPKNNGTSVNDFASLINAQDTKKIKVLCEEIKKDELANILIVTIYSIPNVKKEYEKPIFYGTDLFNHWKIGWDGIIFLITKNDRKTAICTGYLTEHFLPDSEAKKVIYKYMIPNFKKGDYGTGIITGIIEARKVMEKNRRLMYPEKYGRTK